MEGLSGRVERELFGEVGNGNEDGGGLYAEGLVYDCNDRRHLYRRSAVVAPVVLSIRTVRLRDLFFAIVAHIWRPSRI